VSLTQTAAGRNPSTPQPPPPHTRRPTHPPHRQAYALNPAIYSAHLKLHPLLVLCALVVAEHSLGVWGLLLAVPITVFALDYVIRCALGGAAGVFGVGVGWGGGGGGELTLWSGCVSDLWGKGG